MTEQQPPDHQPPPGQTPPSYPPPPPGYHPPGPYPPAGYPPPYQPKPRHPQAITVAVLGCVAVFGGLFTGGLATVVGPFAWVLGARAKREIAAEPDRWADEDLVNLGYILGIIGTVLLALGLLGLAVLIVVLAGLVSGS